MKNIPHPGKIIREKETALTDTINSKVAGHLARARTLLAGLDKAKFDVVDIDAFKRNGRRY